MLAKNLRAPRIFRLHALSLTFFASKLAPTESPSANMLRLSAFAPGVLALSSLSPKQPKGG
ncbi:hypothetical protein DL347_18560 [Pseudomonas fluorescens]|uniref:Uncharacterized protein n=1 Tax=Pseudomonas fluorescens TaxID=294 RepID=A0A7Z6MV68_PSEFL|nr:hypothetical protein DL347_18560 [Pseudomonas fluorescens]